MHELGITVRHGGDDGQNFEPNYLSIMNYSFQTDGLIFDQATAALITRVRQHPTPG